MCFCSLHYPLPYFFIPLGRAEDPGSHRYLSPRISSFVLLQFPLWKGDPAASSTGSSSGCFAEGPVAASPKNSSFFSPHFKRAKFTDAGVQQVRFLHNTLGVLQLTKDNQNPSEDAAMVNAGQSSGFPSLPRALCHSWSLPYGLCQAQQGAWPGHRGERSCSASSPAGSGRKAAVGGFGSSVCSCTPATAGWEAGRESPNSLPAWHQGHPQQLR